VVVSPSRRQAIEKLLINFECDVIISDDGLQHYFMHRDIEIAVFNADANFGNHMLFPSGPLREPIQRLISYINMLHYGASCFGIKLKEKNDLFLDYVNDTKMQTLYKDVKDKFERVFENVICLTTEHFFINQQKQDELKKFLEVSEIKPLSKPQNVGNFNFELQDYHIELANTKLKESIDFYTTLLP